RSRRIAAPTTQHSPAFHNLDGPTRRLRRKGSTPS
ncbi:hypothetical protein AZE42_04192, partial [Rhizopogon vesiculosus]